LASYPVSESTCSRHHGLEAFALLILLNLIDCFFILRGMKTLNIFWCTVPITTPSSLASVKSKENNPYTLDDFVHLSTLRSARIEYPTPASPKYEWIVSVKPTTINIYTLLVWIL
jgi:hypothetical protein